MNRKTLVLVLVPLLAPACDAPGGSEFQIVDEDDVFGAPAAVITDNVYTGPPAVGEYLTTLPHLAELPAGNREHEVRLDVVVQNVEVAPNIRFDAWVFGGSLPGPVLHVREGDRVKFVMSNRTSEAVAISEPLRGGGGTSLDLTPTSLQKPEPATGGSAHSMDFHAGTVAADDKWRSISPGQEIEFEWQANYPGVYLYHCGTPPVLMHMGMGQYGVVVVSPEEGFETDDEVDREFVVVQSEFYLESTGDGSAYQFDFQAAQNRMPTIVAFNGHRNSMIDKPLMVEPGERVRLYLLNVGPSGTWSAHVIGAIFDHVWYEGSPENHMSDMQTVLLGASNGAVVEFIVPEAGEYVLVDHEMADAYLGAVGHILTPRDEGVTKDAGH
ncbi:MAG TPA: multicopper oxidase domain-containing protein [Longimicrobiales bacterium]|nr:multicopper oxidase domain-containing protein [Longimicrobiales bacterium]